MTQKDDPAGRPRKRAPRLRTHRASDLERIAALRLKSWTMAQIAQEVGVSSATVKRELRIIERQWRESASQDIAAVKARELVKLDDLEREARIQWERSCKDGRKVVTEHEPGKDAGTAKRASLKVSRRRIEVAAQSGDPRYLQTILDIGQRRARLLGLDAPTKIAPTNPEGDQGIDLRERDGNGWDLSQLGYEELDALRKMQQKARPIEPPPPIPPAAPPAAGNAST